MDCGEGTYGLDRDILSQLLMARGVAAEEIAKYAAPTMREFLPDPSAFRDMDRAAERIASAVLSGEQITIYGDYDVDGATSAALLIDLLRTLDVDAGYYIPDRLLEGYGPSGEALVKLAELGSSLIVTVDCGAMAHEALTMAREAGVDIVAASSLAAGHLTLVPELKRALGNEGAAATQIIVGGVIPPQDFDALRAAGASAIFPPAP